MRFRLVLPALAVLAAMAPVPGGAAAPTDTSAAPPVDPAAERLAERYVPITMPMLGFALIFTSFPLLWINLLGSVVFALFIPYVAVGQTLLYFDLQVREEEEPARRRQALPWRRSEPVVP